MTRGAFVALPKGLVSPKIYYNVAGKNFLPNSPYAN